MNSLDHVERHINQLIECFSKLQITVSVNPCNQVEQIVRELYPESVCENIIWKQLEKKVARSFNGNWNRLKIEYLIPTHKLAMQLRKKIQVGKIYIFMVEFRNGVYVIILFSINTL